MLHHLAVLLATLFLALGGSAWAQETNSTDTPVDSILVFDASGSMWGQIDGINKIVTAREVVSQLMDDLPANQRMGLLAYGHNRKGDCGDIEMLVPIGLDRDAIRTAVKNINPKGMTPMTDAVIQAAEALKYTENEATVILVSDGEETCHSNPCEAAARLNDLGVNLTVHTVGFGLPEAEAGNAEKQLQCLAANTGGKFFLAADADELRHALGEISQVETKPTPAPKPQPTPDPQPEKLEVTLEATDQETGPVIKEGLIWIIRDGGSGEILYESDTPEGVLTTRLTKGIKDVEVVRASDEAHADGEMNPAQSRKLRIPIIVKYEAQVEAPETASAASTIRVNWEGPDHKNDYIATIKPGADGDKYITYTYTREGSPLNLRLPADPGEYEVAYVQNNGRKVLARKPINTTEVAASLDIPEQADAGGTLRVSWEGPNYDKDYIAAIKPGAGGDDYITYTYTREGSPLNLRLPADPGEYEVAYVQNHGRKVLARKPVNTTEVAVSVDNPEQADAASTIRVSWEGPNYDKDYIAVIKPGVGGDEYITYTYTREGSPLDLRLPADPGEYEVAYVQNHGRKVLARKPINTTEVTASVDSPEQAEAGSAIRVNWEGPDYDKDYIATIKPGAGGDDYITYTYTREGSPLNLKLPPDTGEYEVAYIQNHGRKVLARKSIVVTD